VKDKIFEHKLQEVVKKYDMLEEEKRLELRIYKARWVWYHTILAAELVLVAYLLWEINSKLGALL
tara:strand:+ start:1325 stop:1519 length:195 start_codon:yes stop_codon:yes gene_type:complete